MNTITREELVTRLRDPQLILLEALPEAAFQSGHLPGARMFSKDRVRELAAIAREPAGAPVKTAPIVVYCASETCKNSHEAAKVLEDAGYTDVRVYLGGKADWQAAGLPIERG